MGRRKLGGRYQTGHELDGQCLAVFMREKGPQGGETRAVKRDMTAKALKWWARGQLRYLRGDWELYRPMMEEIDLLMRQRTSLADIEKTVMDRISGRCAAYGTSQLLRGDLTRMSQFTKSISKIENK